MKVKFLIGLSLALFFSEAVSAQASAEKRERRKSTTVKEWNTEGKRQWLDHITVFDDEGFKLEETEYAVYGQVRRITYEYDATGKCIKEVEYDDRNRPVRIRKFEFNPDGSKKKQYNYFPNGRLYSVKIFEYIKN